MSDTSSDFESHPFLDEFTNLISMAEYANIMKKSKDRKALNLLKTNIDNFFMIYSDSDVKDTLFNDISAFFDKIQQLIKSFIKYIDYIKTKTDYSEIILPFQNDLRSFISNFSILIICCADILERIKRMVTKSIETKYINKVLNEFYFEIAIFEYFHELKIKDQPPFYQISSVPIYRYIHDKVHKSVNKFFNIIGPHGSGKTNLIPLFLASRSLGCTIKSQFIILIENDISTIRSLKKLYKQINKNKNAYMKDGVNCLFITSSLTKLYNKMEIENDPTIIAILTPLEGIQLLNKMIPENTYNVTFLKKSTFIFDDVNERKVETDVLAQNILNNVFNLDLVNERAKLVLLGTYSDKRFLTIFDRHCDTFEVPIVTENIKINVINCKNSIEIEKISMISEMKKFFDSWIMKKEVNLGSVIVFVPNVKTGRSLEKKLIKIYQDNSNKIIPLQTRIKKGESLTNYNERLLNDIDNALVERSENPEDAALGKTEIKNDDIIFILPIDFTGNINEEEKQFIQSSLPLPVIEKKLVRVIISTNHNEHYLKVPDATVIFDSGLTETEYYDIKKCVSIFKTEQLPDHDINQRNALIEDNKNNAHFIFSIQNHKKNDHIIPLVKRCDLIQSILQLRKIDISFEKQRNLPNEPVSENVENRMKILHKLNLIDSEEGKLTELGKQVSMFSTVSAYLAIATANFVKNQEFAFLVSLIIDKSVELIENSHAPLLCEHFCENSDVVTILNTILALNTNDRNEIINENEIKFENTGISMSTLEFFYISTANAFNKENRTKGREAVINSIKWSKEQPGGTLAMVDEYINLLDKDDFLNIRKATFEYIVGVGTKSEPTIVYKANDALKFDPSEDALIKYSQRPGCNGLQSPGNIIVLSFQIEEQVKLNRGFLLHRDQSADGTNLGVISQEVKSFLNSCFFVALFESYWNGNPITNDLTPIYHSNKPKKEAGFLIHINECNKKTYLSYCPKTPDVRDGMNESIPFLSSLMPFVPRSVITKSEVPLCAVEIISYGTSQNYETHVYLIDQPDKPKPNAYQLNRQVLEYAGSKIDELRKTKPKIRFSITGESVTYNFKDKRQLEADFSYPNVDENIKSVFDPFHSSHLVLLIDSDYGNFPAVESIPWILNNKVSAEKIDRNESDEINMMIDVSNKIINDLGEAKRSADLFFITLNNGFPSAKKEEIPDSIKNQIGYDESDQGAIKQGIHPLIQQITKNSIRSNNLSSPILLKKLNSTNHCSLYTTEESQMNACDQIKTIISDNLGINTTNIDATFIGPSMICLSISNLDPKRISHPPPDNIWDDSYHPSEIDEQISNILKNNSFPVTSITHEPTVEIIVYHLPRYEIDKNEFEKRVNEISEQYGFLSYFAPEYEKGGHDLVTDAKILGEMTICLIGKNCCIGCATSISKAFPIFQGVGDSLGITVSMTMTMSAMSSMRSLQELNPSLGTIPKIKPLEKAIRVPQCEIESMKDLVKTNKNWRFDENYRVLIINFDDEEEAKRKMQQVRQEKMNTTCFLSCGMDEPELLPQFLYVNEEDGSVKQLGICKRCAKDMLSNYDDIQFVYNPAKHLVDFDRLKQLPTTIKGFELVISNKNAKDEYWPQIPLGQMAWALISDPNDELTSYVKAWFTIVVEYAIQHSDYFMFCPDHPQIPIIHPKDDETVKCPVCDMIFCKDCNSWHKMDAECNEGLINSEVKRCPNCHCPGIRYTGCDHMTCPRCNCQWNYQTQQKM